MSRSDFRRLLMREVRHNRTLSRLNRDATAAVNLICQLLVNRSCPLVLHLPGDVYVLNPDHPEVQAQIDPADLALWRVLVPVA